MRNVQAEDFLDHLVSRLPLLGSKPIDAFPQGWAQADPDGLLGFERR